MIKAVDGALSLPTVGDEKKVMRVCPANSRVVGVLIPHEWKLFPYLPFGGCPFVESDIKKCIETQAMNV
jgi:hypothetical protein